MNSYRVPLLRSSAVILVVIIAFTKSGANDLHGSFYEFFRTTISTPATSSILPRSRSAITTAPPRRPHSPRKTSTLPPTKPSGEAHCAPSTPSSPTRTPGARHPPTGTVTINPAIQPYLTSTPPQRPQPRRLASPSTPSSSRLSCDFCQARIDHYFSSAHQAFACFTIDDAAQRLPTDYPQFPARSSPAISSWFLSTADRLPSSHTFRGSSRTNVGQDVEANTKIKLTPFIPTRSSSAISTAASPLAPDSPTPNWSEHLRRRICLHPLPGRHVPRPAPRERHRDNLYNPTFLGIQTSAACATLTGTPLRSSAPPRRAGLLLALHPDGLLPRTTTACRPLPPNAGIRYEFSSMPKDHVRDLPSPTSPPTPPPPSVALQNLLH